MSAALFRRVEKVARRCTKMHPGKDGYDPSRIVLQSIFGALSATVKWRDALSFEEIVNLLEEATAQGEKTQSEEAA